MIRKIKGKWVLYTMDGKNVLGTHSSKEKALAQEKKLHKHSEHNSHGRGY